MVKRSLKSETSIEYAAESLLGVALQLGDARRLHRSDAEVERLLTLLEQMAESYRSIRGETQ